jgi:hypothetical protein
MSNIQNNNIDYKALTAEELEDIALEDYERIYDNDYKAISKDDDNDNDDQIDNNNNCNSGYIYNSVATISDNEKIILNSKNNNNNNNKRISSERINRESPQLKLSKQLSNLSNKSNNNNDVEKQKTSKSSKKQSNSIPFAVSKLEFNII